MATRNRARCSVGGFSFRPHVSLWLVGICFLLFSISCQRGPAGSQVDQAALGGQKKAKFPPPTAAPIRCELECHWSGRGGLAATASFKNVTDHDVLVWNRNLLLSEQHLWSPFVISRDDVSVQYRGAMVKRSPPTKEEYRLLKPGETVKAGISISGDYDTSSAGVYRIQYRSYNSSPEPEKVKPFDVVSNVVEISQK